MTENKRPDVVDDEYLEYLDTLRKSGVTNMYGACAYLEEEFWIGRKDAETILLYWTETLGSNDR